MKSVDVGAWKGAQRTGARIPALEKVLQRTGADALGASRISQIIRAAN